MDNKYVELFKQLARSTAVSAEQVMEYDREKGDDKGLAAAETMRNDYEKLTETIEVADDEYVPNKAEVAKLLVATMVQMSQVRDRMIALNKALKGYQEDLVPKLQEILDNANDDEEAREMANEKFIIKNDD
jgi:hypothetical protein